MMLGLQLDPDHGGRRAARACPGARLGLSFVAGLAALAFLGASPAHADLKLCNTTASRVGVAIGYKDAEGWATEGWWNIASHTCETLLKGVLIGRFYYIHAVDYDRGGEWAGRSICAPTTNPSPSATPRTA